MTAAGELEQTLAAALAERRADGLYRRRQVVQSVHGPRIVVDGRSLLAFCSNDYLGLRDHPDLAAAAARAAETFGTGAGAAHLISGHTAEHHALEEELAEFVGRPRALLFSTGYMANLGIASALLRRGDAVFEDRLNHASLLDAGLLSGARFRRYPHLDMATLNRRLRDAAGARRRLVMTDAVFSMDGDRAPVAAMARLCTETGSILAVDDAHGFGVLGRDGRGSLHMPDEGSDPEAVPVYMATLGKAAGVAGAFVAGSESLVETLIQEARTYIYTTAMPAPVAAATRAALELVRAEGWRREHLGALVARFRQGARELGLKLCGSDTPIQPLILGETSVATAAAAALLERGLLVPAIRPPTVPEGSARLRVTLSASHEEADVDRLLEALEVAV